MDSGQFDDLTKPLATGAAKGQIGGLAAPDAVAIRNPGREQADSSSSRRPAAISSPWGNPRDDRIRWARSDHP